MTVLRIFSAIGTFFLAYSLIASTPEEFLKNVYWLSEHPFIGSISMNVFGIMLFITILFALGPLFRSKG